jgi:RNA ligase
MFEPAELPGHWDDDDDEPETDDEGISTAGELIDYLATQPRDRKVILRKDAEGNGHSPLADAWEAICEPDSTYSGEVYPTPEQVAAILNYTERCQYERAWTNVTRTCRGLIVHAETGVVIARPWAKFFNYGEHPEGSLDLSAPAEVTDKKDGSLGIMYPAADGWAIATRGSFASEQAVHATRVLRERYPDFEPPDGITVLFEIVYPANRIVVDYGTTDDLILLGAVDIATGEAVGPDWVSLWEGPETETMSARTLAEALSLPPRPGREGVVVRLPGSVMIKLKQDDYVALHRLITGMNARVVWERIGGGEMAEQICAAIPEEFWPWVHQIAFELEDQRDRIHRDAAAEHSRILAGLPEGWTRKDYALIAAKSEHRAWLFNLLDGRDPSAGIWRTLKPSGERTLVAHSEDTA